MYGLARGHMSSLEAGPEVSKDSSYFQFVLLAACSLRWEPSAPILLLPAVSALMSWTVVSLELYASNKST